MINIPKVYKRDIQGDTTNIDTLVVINSDPKVYISKQGQLFHSTEESDYEYFEDRDLKVSGIKESINLKDKKFKIGKVSVSLTNIEVNENKFSNLITNSSLVGVDVQIYYKTQGARTLEDCLKICDGKIQRYTHTDTIVKLEIEDRTMDKIHKTLPLPDNTLYSEFDVLEKHIGKPIPILYGELEKAPAIIYTNSTETEDMYSNNNLLVLYDDAPLSGHTVTGTKQIDANMTDEDTETGILYIKDGEKYLEIPHRAYNNLSNEVLDAHNYPQYQVEQGGYLRLITNYEQRTLLGNFGVLWCHYLDKPISKFILQGYSIAIYSPALQSFTSGTAWTALYDYYSIENKYNWTSETNPPEGNTYRYFNHRTSNPAAYFNRNINTCLSYNFNPFSIEANQYQEIDPSDGKELQPLQSLGIVGNLKFEVTRKTTSPSMSNPNGEEGVVEGNESIDISQKNIIKYLPFPINYKSIYHYSDSGEDGLLASDAYNMAHDYSPVGRIENVHMHWQISDGGTYGLSTADNPFSQTMGIKFPSKLALGLNADDTHTNYRNYFTRDRDSEDWKLNNHYSPISSWNIDCPSVGVIHTEENTEQTQLHRFSHSVVDYNFKQFMLRRYFNVSEGLGKDFYINAIGRDDNDNYLFTEEGKGPLKYPTGTLRLIYSFDDDYTQNDDRIEDMYQDFFIAYEMIKNPDYQYRYVGGKRQTLAITAQDSGGAGGLFYFINPKPIHINFIKQTDSNNPNFLEAYIDADVYWASDDINDVLQFEDTNYELQNMNLSYVDFDTSNAKINLIENIWDLSNVIIHQNPEQDAQAYSNASSMNGEFTQKGYLRYSSDYLSNKKIERPSEIIHHLLQNDLGYNKEINESKFMESSQIHKDWRMAFSINKSEDSKKIIENICRQSRLASTFRIASAEFNAISIKDDYGYDDVGLEIDTRDIIKISGERTKVEDVVTKCRVIYGYDYATEDFKKVTNFTQNSNTQTYLDYYGIDSIDDNIIELEADYIQDEITAKLFRDYYFNMWKNQHEVIKCELPLKYAHLEVSDILSFDVHRGFTFTDLYGQRIDESYQKIDQEVYPYYIVTNIRKKETSIDLILFRLHKLSYIPQESEQGEFEEIVGDDLIIVDDPEEEPEEDFEVLLGDINLDGGVDVLDVVQMVNYVLGDAELTNEQLANGDMNQDGGIDVLDVVQIVNDIIEP